MQSRTEPALIFVSHRVAGVHRIPAAWLDGFAPNGFRPATAAEIRRWHEERGLAPPPELEALLAGVVDTTVADSPDPAALQRSPFL